jgi:hypothetical protein
VENLYFVGKSDAIHKRIGCFEKNLKKIEKKSKKLLQKGRGYYIIGANK